MNDLATAVQISLAVTSPARAQYKHTDRGGRLRSVLRYEGSCELMIGCIGKALGKELHMDQDEMDDVR